MKNRRPICGLLGVIAFGLALTSLEACSGSIPTSVVLSVLNDPGAPWPDTVVIRVFGSDGVTYDTVRYGVPSPGTSSTLGTFVIYAVNGELMVRVQVAGQKGGMTVSEGAARLTLQSAKQVKAEVTLKAGRASDGDRDGVPDEIDNCPTVVNPKQEAASACVGPDAGVADAPGGDGAQEDAIVNVASDGAARLNGVTCQKPTDCASGFCADGVCCESECKDVCKVCNTKGMLGACLLVADALDPRDVCKPETMDSCGLDGLCNGAGACRKYKAGTVCKAGSCLASGVDRALPSTCDGNGACTAGAMQSCLPYVCGPNGACKTACMTTADCAAGMNRTCLGTSCGLKPLGVVCTKNEECNSANCVDGVCCDVAVCAGPCRACNVAGAAGSCRAIAAGADPKAPGCTLEAVATCGQNGKCDGVGACQKYGTATSCANRVCMTGMEIGPLNCNGMGMCTTGRRRDCTPYAGCNGDVCASACAGDGECTAGYFCGANQCRQKRINGQPCSDPRECRTNVCTGGACCAMVCGAGTYCSLETNGGCVPKHANGQNCTASTECTSNFCVDGRCCESACTDVCKQCNQFPMLGRCLFLPAGQRDSNSVPACASPMMCNGSGMCI